MASRYHNNLLEKIDEIEGEWSIITIMDSCKKEELTRMERERVNLCMQS